MYGNVGCNMISKKRLVALCALMSSFLTLTQAIAGHCITWDNTIFQPQPNAAGQIKADYGLYWLKNSGTDSESAAPACRSMFKKMQCMQQLEATGYFNPHKPTILFIHGWQPDTVKNKNRFDLCYSYKQENGQESPLYNTLHYWQNWNVAVFYWNQFADEDNVLAAEEKIYSTQGKQGMRWAYLNTSGQLNYCERGMSSCIMPKKGWREQTILELAYQAYQNAFPLFFHPPELRIAGQSLGAQVAIQLTDLVMHNASLPQPTRLDLMDPYFSPNNINNKKWHIPTKIADYNQQKISDIEALNPQLPIAVYRTSTVSFAPTGNPAKALMDQIAFTYLFPEFLSGQGDMLEMQLHEASIFLYFESMKSKPNIIPGSPATYYANAAASNQDVLNLMRQKRYQVSNAASKHFDETDQNVFSPAMPTHFVG